MKKVTYLISYACYKALGIDETEETYTFKSNLEQLNFERSLLFDFSVLHFKKVCEVFL